MYKRYFRHTVSCGQSGLDFDKMSVRYDYAVSQQALLSGGFETAVMGLKWCEITIEGSVSIDDREMYERFLAAVKGVPRSLLFDGTTYANCVLIESGITTLPDSRIEQFVMKFRSVENGH